MSTITASNAPELSAALAQYRGKTTILLGPGSYGSLKYSNVGSRGSITLTSADPANKAVFEDLQFSNSTGVTLDGLAFNLKQVSGQGSGRWSLRLHDSSNFQVINSTFSGEATLAANASGILVKTSTSVTVENNTFADLQYGVQATDSASLKLLDNSLMGLRADGFQFSDVQNVEVARNFGTNFKADPGAHPDFIQFFTANTTQSSAGIYLHDNVFLQGSGSAAQGIFMGNEAGITYKDVSITNNLIYTSYWHGISVYQADGVVIDSNTVLGVPNNYLGTNNTWIKVSATNARVVHNLANSIDFRTSTGLVRDNVATHWQAKGGTVPYAKIFTNAWAGPSASIDDFLVKSPYAGKGASLMPLYAAGAGRDTTPPSESPPAKQQMPAVPRPPAAVPHDRAPAEPQHQKRTDLLLPASASLPKLEALEPGKIAGTLPRIESSVGIPPRPETGLLPHGSETILTLLELLG